MIQFAMVFVERSRSYRANSRSWRASGIPFTYLAFMMPATRDGVATLPFRSDGVFSGRFMAPHFGQLYTKVTSSTTSNRAGTNFSRFTVSFVTTLYFVLQSGQ